ncbi:hypothetical protein ABT124_30895 [Streptomyces sp. NPDC001982]|uniref:hypothetical protein n=1 Tax=unclassified Streptomyces TaxID=2593676 RepID=UPI0033250737
MEPAAPNAGRYHLVLASAGRPVQHGWWSDEAVARGKFVSWVGEYGTMPDARLVLADEAEARPLAVWPDEPWGYPAGSASPCHTARFTASYRDNATAQGIRRVV